MHRQCVASCNVCPQKVPTPPPPPPPPNQQPPPTSFSKLPPFFSAQIAKCFMNIQTSETPTRNIPTREQFENRGFSIGCLGRNQENSCSSNVCYHLRYRTFDGSCNNLVEGRSLRGAAFMPFGRLRPANYEDGVARMVGKFLNFFLKIIFDGPGFFLKKFLKKFLSSTNRCPLLILWIS
ncbi:unnamed protein product [Meloidogyne enterolobii]|uniref:Uncharacterized protein n=1 Tax=Meloidogyne enterolobii TaxID=390850 RepID=A0ACB1AN82_MELEN